MPIATKTRPTAKTCRAVPYEYRRSDPLPIEVDPEALTILANARGQAAVSELEQALLILDAEMLSCRGRMGEPASVRREMPIIRDILARRAVYVSRLGQLRRALGIDTPPPPTPPEIGAFVRILADTIDGQELHGQLKAQSVRVRAELDQVDAAVEDIAAALGNDARYAEIGRQGCSLSADWIEEEHAIVEASRSLLRKLGPSYFGDKPEVLRHEYGPMGIELARQLSAMPANLRLPDQWPQDLLIEKLDARVRERRALAARLATIEADSSKAREVVAERVGAAVAAGSGPGQIIADVGAARFMNNSLSPQLASIKARLDQKTAELRLRRGDLESLEVATGPYSSASTSIKADIERLTSELETIRTEFSAANDAEASELVRAAMEGDEPSRSAIEALTMARPEAFPRGFPAAIAGARFDRAVSSELDTVIIGLTEAE